MIVFCFVCADLSEAGKRPVGVVYGGQIRASDLFTPETGHLYSKENASWHVFGSSAYQSGNAATQ